eukprot:3190818-Pyramimonas_sp.AAC.1
MTGIDSETSDASACRIERSELVSYSSWVAKLFEALRVPRRQERLTVYRRRRVLTRGGASTS